MGRFFVDHCNFPYVRFVPFAEVRVNEMNDCYQESCRSDFITQGRQSADTVEKLNNLGA
jgi:hypothetical protein